VFQGNTTTLRREAGKNSTLGAHNLCLGKKPNIIWK